MPTANPIESPRDRLGRFAAPLAALLLLSGVAAAQETEPSTAADVLSAIVGVRAEVPEDARTAGALGTERTGSGVVIDGNGLVLTIGYLILEASRAEILLGEGRKIPVTILAYDHDSGFGLLRALQPIDVKPLSLGESSGLVQGDQVLVSSHGGMDATRPAFVVSRRAFAGYWEYLLEEAIFTSPPHPAFGGAALLGPDGALVGIGSLVVGDAYVGERTVPGNMFIPIDELKPILGELLSDGRSEGPQRPWLGIYAEAAGEQLFVNRVADDSPAAAAGIEAGDIIVGVAGETVESLEDFYRKLWALGNAGVEVPLTVLHDNEVADLTLKSTDRYTWLRLSPSE